MFLSIIVPSYNVEEYVEECLKSCLSQNFDKNDYEIIVINDGSKDQTLEVVNRFVASSQATNIHLYSQENRGLSATRNRGITLAQGEYVWFVDSDDWMVENCIQEISETIHRHQQPEVVVLNTILCQGEKRNLIERPLKEESGNGKYIFDNSYIYPYSGAQFYLYKRSFLLEHQLTFKEGIYFEDCLFTPTVMSLASHCAYHAKAAYYYRLRENSITTSAISEKKLHDMKTVAEELILIMDNPQVRFKDVLQDAACRNFEVLFRYYILKSDSALQRKYLRLLLSEGKWKSVLPGARLKHQIYYRIMRGYALFRG